MAPRRKLPTLTEEPSDLSGNQYAQIVQDTIEAVWALLGGQLINVGGTASAMTADLNVATDFTAVEAGFDFTFKAPYNSVDGGTTIDISSVGPLDLKHKNGNHIEEGDWAAGDILICRYNSVEDFAVVMNLGDSSSSSSSPIGFSVVTFFTTDDTWTAPYDCWVRIWCFGPGGSAAHTNSINTSATGGGAGGMCHKLVFVTTGTEIDLVVGQGGAAASTNSNGNAGDHATTAICSNPTISMSAELGTGGERTGGAASGGTGGTASGGDANFSGGDGQDSGNDGDPNRTRGGLVALNKTAHAYASQTGTVTPTDVNPWNVDTDNSRLGVMGPFSAGQDIFDATSTEPSQKYCSGSNSSVAAKVGGDGLVAIEVGYDVNA